DGHQCQPPGGFGRLPAGGEEGGEGAIFINGPDLVPHTHIEVALGECGSCDAGGLWGNSSKGLRMQRHSDPPYPALRAEIPSWDKGLCSCHTPSRIRQRYQKWARAQIILQITPPSRVPGDNVRVQAFI